MCRFLKKMPGDKVKINWNKSPIEMELFLSFLMVDTTRSNDHLGYTNGWTRLYGDNDLTVGGGRVGGVEYLDNIQYGKNLDNGYNNYVNPFYLFEIMTGEGKEFFLNYYSDEISGALRSASKSLSEAGEYKSELFEFWGNLGAQTGGA